MREGGKLKQFWYCAKITIMSSDMFLLFQTKYKMSLSRSFLVVGVRGLQLPASGVVRGLHTSLVVTAGEKMGKPDPKWPHYCHDCENKSETIIVRLVLKTTRNNVTTLTMNNPKKLNGWSGPMMLTLRDRCVGKLRVRHQDKVTYYKTWSVIVKLEVHPLVLCSFFTSFKSVSVPCLDTWGLNLTLSKQCLLCTR